MRHGSAPAAPAARAGIAFTLAVITSLAAPANAAPLNQTGRWVASPSLGFSSTHTVVLREPDTDATKVFMFGESGTSQTMRFWRFFPGDTNLITPTTVSPRSSFIALPHPNNLQTDLFCTGHATLPDGRMLMVGGGWIPLSPCREVYTLDPAWRPGVIVPTTPWTASAQMAVQRWYATATPLPDGGVLASAGTMSSGMIGFGGSMRVRGADTTWRVLQPLNLATRYSWGDTTAAPGDTCTVGCKPARYRGLRWTDGYTRGRYPPGRDGHVFVGDYSGRCIVFGGRRKLANGSYEVLGDAWHLYTSLAEDDTTHGWSLMEQVGDPSLPSGANTPGPRWGCAATWAGVENRYDTQLPETSGALICYIHGGRDASGQVLGDLWRGERRLVAGPKYQWAWTRIFAGDASTRRFGHTMMFDPGAPGISGAPRAKLVIFGGWTGTTSLADPRKLDLVGVGPMSVSPGVWREITVSGTTPVARAWHGMTPRWRDAHDGEREYYMFGGESGGSETSARPVPGELWVLERPDESSATEENFHWTPYLPFGQGPTGRSRPALGYNVDGGVLVVAGGDTTGSAVAGGQTDAIWTVTGETYGGTITWHSPIVRGFHPPPPPFAGMGLVALGAGHARITRSLERFSPLANSGGDADCGPLFGQWRTITTPDSASERPISDYANMFVLPDGRLFNAGPALSLDPVRPGGRYKRFFDLRTARWVEGPAGDQHDALQFGSSVMYRPGRLLRAGSTSTEGTTATQTIDIGTGQFSPWVPYVANGTTRPALIGRTHHNLTLLPTGDVLATGGVYDDDDVVGSAIRTPQIWSVARGRWSNPVTSSTEALAPDPWIRNYHSTAVLLPDARVLTAGGEKPSPDEAQTSASIYEPPYLFRANGAYATRPRVVSAPARVGYGGDFTLLLEDPARTAGIRAVALMRPGASTHGFDQGQRYVPLDFVALASPARLLVHSPADANLAPPGDYLLFVIDSLATDAPAVPSVARWVRVDGSAVAPVDSADVVAPRGGDYLALRDESQCADAQVGASVTVHWTAPADDDTTAFSGPASAYELRYTPNANAAAPFSAWTRLFTSTPGRVGSTEGRILPGLKTSEWYVFALRAMGDGGDTSTLSRALLTKPLQCAGGAGFGSLVAGNQSTLPTNGLGEPGDVGAGENSLFPGVPPGIVWPDLMPLSGAPQLVDGTRRLYIREGLARGMVIDRLILAYADHAPGAEAVTIPGGSILVGQRRAALRVLDAVGRDLTAQAIGTGLEPIRVDSAATLFVTLAPPAAGSEDVLVVESSWGSTDRNGISVDAAMTGGLWRPVGTIHPRRGWSTQALLLRGARSLRFRLNDALALRFIGRLDASAYVSARGASPVLARKPDGTSRLAEVMATDDRSAIVVPGDTLLLGFTDYVIPAGSERSWFLVVDGKPVTSEMARELADPRLDAPGPAPVAFRLHPNVPNPFSRATRFDFDLPHAADVELEVFDLQGRLVRRFASHEGAGRRSYHWDLLDGDGHRVAPGVYAYRLRAGPFTAERKLVVM
ncbi:MAG TPA: galactose oxidase-like domain-containing protein [Methylomirabilota bacterium]|nr:galactose oxidase-like domain-containing protein [Methylomirabilota bacterium]